MKMKKNFGGKSKIFIDNFDLVHVIIETHYYIIDVKFGEIGEILEKNWRNWRNIGEKLGKLEKAGKSWRKFGEVGENLNKLEKIWRSWGKFLSFSIITYLVSIKCIITSYCTQQIKFRDRRLSKWSLQTGSLMGGWNAA